MVLLSRFRLAGTVLKAARALAPRQAAATAGRCAAEGSLCPARPPEGRAETPLTPAAIFRFNGAQIHLV